MNIKKLSSREKKVLYITVIFIALVLLYVFIFSPLLNKWSDTQRKIEEKLASMEKKLEVLNRSNWLEEWRKSFPFDLDTPELKQGSTTKILSYIEDLTRKSNLEIINISPGNIQEHGGYQFIFIELSFKGELENVVDFLYNVESSAMMFRVDGLEIDSTTEKSKNVRVSLEIRKLKVL